MLETFKYISETLLFAGLSVFALAFFIGFISIVISLFISLIKEFNFLFNGEQDD